MDTLRRLWRLVGLPQTAISAGLVATVCLVVGSLAMQLDPKAYEGLPGEDVTFLWKRWSPLHAWLAGAIASMGPFTASGFVCTVDALRLRLRARARSAAAWATPLMHIGFLIGLLGHLVSAVSARPAERLFLGEEPVEARSIGVRLRLLDAKVTNGPTGEPRRVDAKVEVAGLGQGDPAPSPTVRHLGYNRPIVLEAGRALVLLLRPVPAATSEARFRVGGEERIVRVGDEMRAGGAAVVLAALFGPPRFRTEIARVRVTEAGQGEPAERIVPLGASFRAGGEEIAFLGVVARTALAALADRNEGAPILFGGMIVFSAGALLFSWTRIRRR